MGKRSKQGRRQRNQRVTVACAVCGTERPVRASIAAEWDYFICYTHEDISDFLESVSLDDDEEYFLHCHQVTNLLVGCMIVPDPDGMLALEQSLKASQTETAEDALLRCCAWMLENGYSPWEGQTEEGWEDSILSDFHGEWDPDREPQIEDAYHTVRMIPDAVLEAILNNGHPQRSRILTFTAEVADNPGHLIGGNFDVVSAEYAMDDIDRDTHYTHEYMTFTERTFFLSGDFEDYVDILACARFGRGSVVVREFLEDESNDPVSGFPWKTVTGYSFGPNGVGYLTEAEVFDAFCTRNDTGDPIPPEPSVRYIASPSLELWCGDDTEDDDG